MPLILSVAAAALVQVVPACSWNEPGRDPFSGDPVEAVEAYKDIPPATRQRLAKKLADEQFDDDVTITRSAIVGSYGYRPEIRGMYFGANRMCERVGRQGWTADHVERGHVVCEGETCLLLPVVCGNLSRIRRTSAGKHAGDDGELQFEPPSAGGGAPVRAAAPLKLPLALDQSPEFVPPVVDLPALPGPPALVATAAPAPPLVWGIPSPPGGAFGPPPVIVVSSVPEPASWGLFAAGIGVLVLVARRKR